MTRLFPALLSASLILHTQNASAQLPDTIPALPLEGVTVSVTRDAADPRHVTQRVDFVPVREMIAAGANDVADGLRSTTPIDVITYPGLLTGVSVRGFRPQITGINPRTMLLVNGRPAGTTNLSLLPLTSVERVEVLRGPASALYGSSAMGGVVNVITAQSRTGLAGSATLGYGSFGRYEGSVRIGGALAAGADFDLALATSGHGDDFRTGARRTFGSDDLAKIDGEGVESTVPRIGADSVVDFARYRVYSGLARVGIPLGSALRLDLSGDLYFGDDIRNPGDLTPQDFDGRSTKNVDRNSLDATLSGAFDRHEPMLRIFRTSETLDYFDAPMAPHFVNFRTPTRTLGAQLQDVVRFGLNTLTVGADLTRTTALSEAFSAASVPAAPYNPDAALRSAALFSQARVILADDRAVLTAGARLDNVGLEIRETPHLSGYPANEEDHLVLSPNAGAQIGLTNALRLYGNIGRAFVAPEPFSVAGYVERSAGDDRSAVNITRGNASLRPESSWTWDAGFTFDAPGGVQAEIGYFSTRVTNRIATVLATPETPELTAGNDTILSVLSYENVDESEISGVEGQLSYHLTGLPGARSSARLFANGTRILRAIDRNVEAGTTRAIYNVADLTLIGGIEAEHASGLSGRLSARYVGEREDTDYVAWWAPGTIHYPAYLVVDLSAGIDVGDRYRIGIQVRNLGNEDYFEIRGYNQPGRSFGLRLDAVI